MNVEYCQRLLGILARLDRLETEANAILDELGDTDNIPMTLELVELLMDMRAKVEAKLDRRQRL
jgi:hypothetical protein